MYISTEKRCEAHLVTITGAAPLHRYIYIDGGYVRQRFEYYASRYFNGDPLDFDYNALFHEYQKRFYYDCLPPRRNGEDESTFKKRKDGMRDFFTRLRELRGFHVYEGKLSGDGERVRQKGVDIQLAVHMLTHVSRGIVRRVTLMAGDADFEPLAEAVVAEGAFLTLWADKRSVSTRLRHAADEYEPFHISNLFAALSSQFKSVHPLPEVSGRTGQHHEGLSLLRRGVLPDGSEAKLYAANGRAILIYPSTTTSFMHITWQTPELVMHIAEDLGANISWNNG